MNDLKSVRMFHKAIEFFVYLVSCIFWCQIIHMNNFKSVRLLLCFTILQCMFKSKPASILQVLGLIVGYWPFSSHKCHTTGFYWQHPPSIPLDNGPSIQYSTKLNTLTGGNIGSKTLLAERGNITCRAGQAVPKVYLPHWHFNSHCQYAQNITCRVGQVYRALFCLPDCRFFVEFTRNRAGGYVARCLMWMYIGTPAHRLDTLMSV